MKIKLFSFLVLALSAFPLRAATIAQWTFETSIPTTAGPISPEVGSGTGTAFHADGATVYSNPVGNGSTESWSSDRWAIGDYYQFQVSTLGNQNIVVSWNQTRSGTGPTTFDFGYSLNGSSFTIALNNYIVPSITWSSGAPDATGTTSFSVNLSSVLTLNNVSAAYFRLIADSSPGGIGGTSRIDNFTVGTATVPETLPFGFSAAILLAILGLSRWLSVRRAKA